MIIEFLGVSGVGKTTLAKKYQSELEYAGRHIIWDTYNMYANNGWLNRNIKKSIVVSRFFIRNHLWVYQIYDYIKGQIASPIDRIGPLFNAIYLKKLYSAAQKDESDHLFDEGVFQLLMAIKLRNSGNVKRGDVLAMIDLFGCPTKIISVNAPASIIASRLVERGEHVKLMEYGEILPKIETMLEVQQSIVDLASELTTVEKIDNYIKDDRCYTATQFRGENEN